jgi:hypothetical protein
VGGGRSWIRGEGCGGGWAGVVIRGEEDEDEEEEEEEGSPCGEDGCLGSEPDPSSVDVCVFSVAGVGGSSWIRGEGEGFWVVGLVEGGLVGGELVDGGEIRCLRVDNGGGEGGVTGGEEGPDTKGINMPFCSVYVQRSSKRLCAMFLTGKERGGAKKYP